MALSSLLLGKSKSSIDKELDSLFKTDVPTSRPAPPTTIASSSDAPNSKRKHESTDADHEEVSKRVKGGAAKDTTREKKPQVVEKRRTKKQEKVVVKEKKKEAKEQPVEKDSSEDEVMANDEDEDNSDLENAYLMKTLSGKKGKEKARQKESDDEEDEEEDGQSDEDVEEKADSSSSDEDALPPQHETVSKSSKKRSKAVKVKYVPSEETQEQRDSRTIFVGNLSVEVAHKKSLRKQLQRHVLSLIPTTSPKPKIESIRFRSVPFSVPTSTLPQDEDDPKSKGKGGKKPKSSRPHDLERTSNWKGQHDEGETEKKFLTPAQKKKVAFINQNFHESANDMHAYIVFAHPPLPGADNAPARKSNLPPPAEVMDPYEAARLAKEVCDGSTFMDRVLRVDIAAKNPVAAVVNTEGRVVKTDVDPKKCVFVGNLDFESKEEDVRVFFEGVISSEKGPRPPDDGKEEEESDGEEAQAGSKPRMWVKRVRIIRDKDTQLGKGFAYVQFVSHECVDEILALEPSKLKFAKRKLRVERCKTLPGVSAKLSSKPKSDKTSKSTKPIKSSRPTGPVSVPKGDPSLGEKLVHMSKEDRKKAKASDPDRLARRLAKKKARNALATPGKDSDGIKVLGKDRTRDRKNGFAKGKKGKTGVGSSSKGRVRSEKAATKRNMKK
ncbi:Nucleolar protein 12 [Marasmius tenuissimus]|uniref:Nucleolar protein 12 n=1 Tax=Marasmius tenuissimus TaxID=585030 RepID=A0ABR2ZY35_9AGAR